MLIKLILALLIGNGYVFAPGSAQNLLDRLRPVNVTRFDDGIKVVSGTKVKRYERLTVPLGGPAGIPGSAGLLGPLLPPQPAYLGYTYVSLRHVASSPLFSSNLLLFLFYFLLFICFFVLSPQENNL